MGFGGPDKGFWCHVVVVDIIVERLNQLFLHGAIRADMRKSVVTAVTKVAATNPLRRVKMAVNLILVSVDYQIQK